MDPVLWWVSLHSWARFRGCVWNNSFDEFSFFGNKKVYFIWECFGKLSTYEYFRVWGNVTYVKWILGETNRYLCYFLEYLESIGYYLSHLWSKRFLFRGMPHYSRTNFYSIVLVGQWNSRGSSHQPQPQWLFLLANWAFWS